MERYYKCHIESLVGKKIGVFWRKAIHAAKRADAYARAMGAVSYIQPVQYFEGGVDFLEFAVEPDAEVWRKKVLGDNVVYEPNCMAETGVMILHDGQKHPSDTWNRIYNKEQCGWQQIGRRYSLEYWASAIGYTLSGDNEVDRAAIDSQMRGKTFVTYIELSGDQKQKRGAVPSSLRRAVKAEKMRMSLPVVTVEEFFSILSFQMPDTKKGLAELSRSLVTPTFFKHDCCYFFKTPGECVAEDLISIERDEFVVEKDLAVRDSEEEIN